MKFEKIQYEWYKFPYLKFQFLKYLIILFILNSQLSIAAQDSTFIKVHFNFR